MRKTNEVEELASKIVGDGKGPNKYFITLGFGWYIPYKLWENREEAFEMPDMIQVKGGINSVTIGPFNSLEAANEMFYSLKLPIHPKEITKYTLSQIIMEDRKTGVVKEKCLWEMNKGYFVQDNRDY